MRFMMLIKSDARTEAGAGPTQELMEAMVKYNDDLVDAGALIAAEGLHASSQGARVKFSSGKPAVTMGPFASPREIIAGYWLIRAKSKQEAIEWAKRIPVEARDFAAQRNEITEVEVRQVFELEDFPVNEEESGWREAEARFRAQPAPAAENLKQFIIFRKADENSEAGVMPGERLLAAMGAYNEEMIKAGIMVAGEGLQPSSKGARIYWSKGKRSVAEGPFTDTQNMIAGFTVIRAMSMQEALGWVKRWPAIDLESEVELEVRQVFGPDEFGPGLTPELREAEEFQRQRIAALQWPPDY